MSRIGNSIETESKLAVARGCREAEWEVIANGYGWGFFLGWWTCSNSDCSDGCTNLWIYQNPLICTLSKGEFYNMWYISVKLSFTEVYKNLTLKYLTLIFTLILTLKYLAQKPQPAFPEDSQQLLSTSH